VRPRSLSVRAGPSERKASRALRTQLPAIYAMKPCTACRRELPPTAFSRGSARASGEYFAKSKCRTCEVQRIREQRLRHRVADPPPAACECCGREEKLHLDHSKDTKQFRGWLCRACNTGIGQLGDRLVPLHDAAAYLLLFLDRAGLSETTRPPVAEGCRRCGESREEADFSICAWTARGPFRSKTCRFCKMAIETQRRGLAKIVGPPAQACQICRREGPTVLDHCHATGAFRGWLCRDCNIGLGRLGDDLAGVRRAISYLLRSCMRESGPDQEERARSRSPRHHGDVGGAPASPESR
jgi:Recombination endonuclease VII